MTIKYTYNCSICDYDYTEQRTIEEPQYFLNCHKCGTEFNFVSETPLEDN